MTNHLLRRTAAALALGAFTTTVALASTVGTATAGTSVTTVKVEGGGVIIEVPTDASVGRSVQARDVYVFTGTKTLTRRTVIEDLGGIVALPGCTQIDAVSVHCGEMRSTYVPVIFRGGPFADRFDGRNTISRVSAQGGGGNDVLYGGTESDVLLGNAGSDYLHGGSGLDRLEGTTYYYGNPDWDTCVAGETNFNCDVISAS